MSNKINYWEHNSSFHTKEYSLNSLIAKQISEKDSLEELSKAYTHINSECLNKFFKYIPEIEKIFVGKGIDLGGGPGVLSGTLIKYFKNIKILILLELCAEALKYGFPIVDKYLLDNTNRNKIYPICGSFDQINLQNKSLDFAVAWDVIHHSLDPIKTLKEVKKVLKSNGYLIIVDRAHDDKTPQAEIDRMLNIIYPEKFIESNFLKKGTILSRRDNGEHEYRFKEWKNFFKKSGFKIIYEQLFLENHPRNEQYLNDADIKQQYLSFEIGGFERRKVVFVLKPN